MGDPGGSWLTLRAAAVNASRPEDAGLGLSRQAQLVLEILMVLMCAGAVTGNILVIVIVAATKTLHSVTSVLIMNLAISDLLVGVGVMPFVALSVMNRNWVDCTDLCLYVGYTSSVYCTVSVLTLAAIALDRYHSIMDCLRYSSRCTLRRACAVVLWIWLQALATSCPPLLGWGSISYVVPMYSCVVIWASSPSYTGFMAAISYLVPAVVILFCYVNIVKVARSHARRIHTLENSIQHSRDPNPAFSPNDSSHQHCGSFPGPNKVIYHVSGQFVPGDGRDDGSPAVPDSTTEQNASTSRRSAFFWVQNASQPAVQNSQQQHNQHGVLRLLLVILAFFLCWTPHIAVSLVQATETAISGRSSLVPPSAVTFSYWLVLLNSDINPLLYALLSKRFQGALQGLRQKLRARLESIVGRGWEVRAQGEDGKSSDPCTLTSNHPRLPSSSEESTWDDANYSSSVFTVSAAFKHNPEEHLCNMRHQENTLSPNTMDYLHVPCWPQEGRKLPFSALTKEHQATFFFGKITVRVEHDVC